MGTSSNFGNMFSAAAASSAVLSFLPLLPSQILLNNLLYDASQLTIPTDRVDPEQLQAPSHWDIAFIRRFMLFFGPISSVFDFLTFALMLGVFQAGPDLFRTGWFAEPLATQTLVIFVIRTRRSPFTRSRSSRPLLVATITTVIIGAVLPLSPLSRILGFAPLPVGFFLALAAMVVGYLVLIELAKRLFFADPEGRLPHLSRRGRHTGCSDAPPASASAPGTPAQGRDQPPSGVLRGWGQAAVHAARHGSADTPARRCHRGRTACRAPAPEWNGGLLSGGGGSAAGPAP